MAYKTAARNDNVQEVTDRILAALEKGVAPWLAPWDKGPAGLPHNGHTNRAYHGVNVLLLWLTGFTDARWYTFKQVSEGGYGASHVRKGEKGTKVVFWRFLEKEVKGADGQVVCDDQGDPEKETVPLLRVFTVFNHDQVEWEDGMEPGKVDTVACPDPTLAFEEARAYFEALPVTVTHAGGRACYNKVADTVTLPPMTAFNTEADYWATRAHELIHWTGHKSRCDREFGKRFGDMAYAAEELVAEMGAAFLCASLGVKGNLQHAEYIAHWIEVMKADKYAVFTAARKAQDAVAFLDEAGTASRTTHEAA